MKILIISKDMLGPDVYLRMAKEGNEVALACKNDDKKLDGSVKKIPFGKREKFYDWADLIIFDDTSFGDEPKNLREEGKCVVGGSKMIDKLELDRVFSAEVASACGLKVPATHKIDSLEEAKKFIEDNPGRWVMKQQGKLDTIKGLSHVGKLEDGSDMIDHLDWMESIWVEGLEPDFVMQEFVSGHEFACGAWWNGNDFLRDEDGDILVEENFEHKPLVAGDRGEATGEMFTLMRYRKAKDSKMFNETLEKCRDMLVKADFRGNFDINCKIVDGEPYFLEFTPRFGVPAASAQTAIHKTPWSKIFYACGEGKQVEGGMHVKEDLWCIVAWLVTKPFPSLYSEKYSKLIEEDYERGPKSENDKKMLMQSHITDSMDVIVNFKEELTKEDWNNVHYDGVYCDDDGRMRVGNHEGFVLTVTGLGKTPEEAGTKVDKLMDKFIVPKSFYRNDWCCHYDKAKDDLKEWGYL